MVRNYSKKTNRANISEESIVAALNDYRNGNYRSIREAAEAHGLKKSTLHFRPNKIKQKEDKNENRTNENKADKPNNEEGADHEHNNDDGILEEQPIKEITTDDMTHV